MDFQLLGKEDTFYEEDGHACSYPHCGLAAIYRYHDGRDGYVYACDDHSGWASLEARACNCDDCRLRTNRPRIWHEAENGQHQEEFVLCPECWEMRHEDYVRENPSEFDEPVLEENPYAIPEGVDEDDDNY